MNITDGGVWMRWQWWVALLARGLVTVVWAVCVAFMLAAYALLDLIGEAVCAVDRWVERRCPNGVREALRKWGEG